MQKYFLFTICLLSSQAYCSYKPASTSQSVFKPVIQTQPTSACVFTPSQTGKYLGYQIYSAHCTPSQNPFQQCIQNSNCYYTPALKLGTLYNAGCPGKQLPCLKK